MNPAIIVAAFDAALSLIEKLAPVVQQLFQNGDITIEQQAVLKARIEALNQSDTFSGPEWKRSTDE